MNAVAFTIHGQPPSHKNGYRIVTIANHPAIVKSKDAIAYEKGALLQIPSSARLRLEGPVRITLRLFYTSERPDLDESLILDLLQDRYTGKGENRQLLQHGVYRNDRQVREKHVFHAISKGLPRSEIVVEPIQQILGLPLSADTSHRIVDDEQLAF